MNARSTNWNLDRNRDEPMDAELASHGIFVASFDFRLNGQAPHSAAMQDISGACLAGEKPAVYTELAEGEWECRPLQREYDNPDILVFAVEPVPVQGPSLQDLWRQIHAHPDFAGGALFPIGDIEPEARGSRSNQRV